MIFKTFQKKQIYIYIMKILRWFRLVEHTEFYKLVCHACLAYFSDIYLEYLKMHFFFFWKAKNLLKREKKKKEKTSEQKKIENLKIHRIENHQLWQETVLEQWKTATKNQSNSQPELFFALYERMASCEHISKSHKGILYQFSAIPRQYILEKYA